MKTFSGISASPGIAIGKSYLHIEELTKFPSYAIEKHQASSEYQRFRLAVERAIAEIEQLKESAFKELRADEVNMLDTHLLMLSDPDFAEKIEKGIRESLLNVESVLSTIMQDLIGKLKLVKDEYLRERTADFHDVGKRVLNQLLYVQRKSIAQLESDILLVCKDLMPSDAISMDKIKVKGIAMDAGGKTSHTAILARAFEIPAVLGLNELSSQIQNGTMLIIDGNKGKVILEPDDATIAFYTSLQKTHQKREVQLLRLNDLSAETKDGKLIKLLGNIEIPEEVDAVLSHGADGVGLFRSEFLFLRSASLPNEEEQFEAYSRVLKAMGKLPVTIRTLDIGGDKLFRGARAENNPGVGEKNPILGWRAIRFCLSQTELFCTQLRAILRASVYGNLKIMFPLISGIQELKQALEILEQVKADLRKQRKPFNEDVPVGIMIEVPSAALTVDILAKKSAFFSIGTNDLIQYTLAVDRGNEHVAYLYEPLHPALIRLTKRIIDDAHKAGLSVSMCGEMAGDPLYALVLLGLGLDEFSMSSFGIPEVKRIIRSTSITEAEEVIATIMDMSTASEIGAFVKSVMEERFEINYY